MDCFFCQASEMNFATHEPCDTHRSWVLPPGWLCCDKHRHLEPDASCSCWPDGFVVEVVKKHQPIRRTEIRRLASFQRPSLKDRDIDVMINMALSDGRITFHPDSYEFRCCFIPAAEAKATPSREKPEGTLMNDVLIIPMLLWCPECGRRHIDEGEFASKAHHTHACQHCGHVWRPAIEHTRGVQFLPGFKNATS